MSREDGCDRAERKSNRDKNNALAVFLYEKFKKKFPTPEAALNYLYRRLHSVILICRNCGATLPEDTAIRRVPCPKCDRFSWVTSNTFLAHMKKPVAWLAAI